MKIITKAPKDVYGADRWFVIQTDESDTCGNIAYVHWSILTDEERDAVWRAWFEDM